MPFDGGQPIRSPRETTQPNRIDAHYWATGLTPVYLEGALQRALNPRRMPGGQGSAPAIVDVPGPGGSGRPHDAVLNPFSLYEKGEMLLRRQLSALSTWHLTGVIRAHGLGTPGRDIDHLPASALIDLIVREVRRTLASPERG